MLKIENFSYPRIKNEILKGDTNWVIVSTINFEECSIFFIEDLIRSIDALNSKKIKFYTIRLISKRASPWSALETVKQMFEKKLKDLASMKGVEFEVVEIEYPIGPEIVYNVLLETKELFNIKSNFVIDLSAMPREMVTHFCDKLCNQDKDLILKYFNKVFVLFTPPDRITSRAGLGPFTVGQPKFIFSQGLTSLITSKHKTNLLVFLGYEGFEAKSVIDTFTGHNTNIVCAVSCFNSSYMENLNVLVGNQAIVMDSEKNNNVDIKYYFSSYDILRVSLDFLNQSLRLFEEFPNKDHAMIVAPFGPKVAIFFASYIGNLFKSECAKRNPNKEVISDVITLPVSQYVSLYSRGNKLPETFEISKTN